MQTIFHFRVFNATKRYYSTINRCKTKKFVEFLKLFALFALLKLHNLIQLCASNTLVSDIHFYFPFKVSQPVRFRCYSMESPGTTPSSRICDGSGETWLRHRRPKKPWLCSFGCTQTCLIRAGVVPKENIPNRWSSGHFHCWHHSRRSHSVPCYATGMLELQVLVWYGSPGGPFDFEHWQSHADMHSAVRQTAVWCWLVGRWLRWPRAAHFRSGAKCKLFQLQSYVDWVTLTKRSYLFRKAFEFIHRLLEGGAHQTRIRSTQRNSS